MKRFITLKAGWLLLHLFHFLFFSLYFKSIQLSALLLIFNFLFPSSTFVRQHTFLFFHTHSCYLKLLSLFIVFLCFLSYYTRSLPSILSPFTFIFYALFLPANRLYTN